MTELREWIVEHGVDVRNLRMEGREQGVEDTGDYMHWLERKVLEQRAAVGYETVKRRS
jgi:hypothetical protein